MNGIVANLTLPPARRLVRGILILACSVLSVSLIGAVHTRPFDVVRPAEPAAPFDTAAPIDFNEDDAVPAAAKELLRDVKTGGTSDVPAEVKQVAGSITSSIVKTLVPPPAPTPVAPRFTVRLMEVTAYCACKKCCGPRAQGITASGRPVSFNGGRFVAADRMFSFNTKLLIPGYADGQAVPVLDRGGAIKGNKLDVYFPSHQEARVWGRRFIPVTVLN